VGDRLAGGDMSGWGAKGEAGATGCVVDSGDAGRESVRPEAEGVASGGTGGGGGGRGGAGESKR
jgi:hypothetical protein